MKQRRPFFLVLGVVAVVLAIWCFMLLRAPQQLSLDQRVQQVASQLKCPVCQNESVADSPTLLAHQMRDVIRQQLRSGKSEQQVMQSFVSSYGQSIIWSPPWQGFALLAWLAPIALLCAGAALLFFTFREWSTPAPATRLREEKELEGLAQSELERYRAELERELASDDPLFERYRTEAR
ncbi:cytochrome c-type biogenesis protein CcmH [Ktedonosporobacter rubrisoli]|uniref:Cytochrome c-type biogenesis protein n=1 Tax=Ktedonosporobacter rubrisoli TaxID=2509675 RepID=A0A4V0YZX3_KTERU|nr:cytochrome c-type biogenesis protein CcmH [Ktedonosporobacter rubrisoli]QBD81221.1 cytochrome c-type biogenesis protein CcmH [Ktedonosporobacter rubrisoli]